MSENNSPVTARAADAGNPAFREILEQIGNTKEIRQLAGNLLPELIRLWAVSGTGAGAARTAFRKSVASVAGNSIKNALLDEQGLAEAQPLHVLAVDPTFAPKASAQAGDLAKGALDVLVKAIGQIEGQDAAMKKRLLETILRDFSSGKSAALITSCCRVINDIHRDEPAFLARVLAPEFEKWLRSMDFGELKEVLETALPGISALIRMINQTLWKYPAKMISIVSLMPTITNMAIDALAQFSGSFNEEGTPDMVADVLLTILRETDTAATGRLLTELAEMTRRLHVGSALIGEPGAPQLPNDLLALFEAIIKAVDGEILLKARTALAELKGQAHCALTDALAKNPALLAGGIANASAVRNARIRAVSHRLSTLEGFIPETINDALAQSLAGLDVQEGANSINAAVALLTRLLEARPDQIRDKATALVDALDIYGLSELCETTGKVVGTALRPLARSLVPALARGVIASLADDDDEFEDAAAAARQGLADLLNSGEADYHG